MFESIPETMIFEKVELRLTTNSDPGKASSNSLPVHGVERFAGSARAPPLLGHPGELFHLLRVHSRRGGGEIYSRRLYGDAAYACCRPAV